MKSLLQHTLILHTPCARRISIGNYCLKTEDVKLLRRNLRACLQEVTSSFHLFKQSSQKAYIGLGWPVVLRCQCGLVDIYQQPINGQKNKRPGLFLQGFSEGIFLASHVKLMWGLFPFNVLDANKFAFN